MSPSFQGVRERLPAVLAVSLLLLALSVLTAAGPAAAHVSVSSPDAEPGGFGKLVFRVPTESDNASTVKLTVRLPADAPFAFVSAKPLPGWSVATTERRLDSPVKAEGFTLTRAVATVTWAADQGQGIGPGEFDEFELSVGPFAPSARAITLPVDQSYSDGTVVRWDRPMPASGKEPEHPAPTLELAADEAASDGTARALGGTGLALGLVALVVALLSARRRPG